MENKFFKHLTRSTEEVNQSEAKRQSALTKNSLYSAIVKKEGEVEKLSTAAEEIITSSKSGDVNWDSYIEKDNLQEIAKDELKRLIDAYKLWFDEPYTSPVLEENKSKEEEK